MTGRQVKRRTFLALAGAAVAWPTLSRAQSSAIPTIGFVHARSREDTGGILAAFKKALTESGFEEGRSVRIEWRFADGHYDRLPEMAAELVARKVSLIVGGSDPAALAAKAATSTIPIVFAVGLDPVRLKLVDGIGRPAGNATGISILTASLEPKRLGLLRDLLGPDRRLAVLINPKLATAPILLGDIDAAANAIGWKAKVYQASAEAEIDAALEQIEAEHVSALEVAPDPFFDTQSEKFASWAAQRKIPTMFQFRSYAQAGGLMSYGIDLADAYRQVGLYAARVLKGESPANLPVLQPTKFEFVINMRTARILGLTFPPDLISIADEVID